jgi:hypothetical protein
MVIVGILGMIALRSVPAQTVLVRADSLSAMPMAAGPSAVWSGQNDTIDPRLPDAAPYTSFERYSYAEECAKAVAWNEDMVWATRRRDSVALGRYGNPLDSSAVAAGRQCLARLPTPLTAPRDLLGLGATYLALDNDSAAATAFARAEHDAGALSPERRAWVKTFIIEVYLDAAQPRFAAAATIEKELDALGAMAAIPRMMAHIRLAQAGMRSDSVALWDGEARAAIAAIGRATPEARREYAFEAWEGYWLLLRARLRVNDVVGAKATVDHFLADIVPVQPFLQRRADFANAWIKDQGLSAPPIRATRWANVSGPADTIYPKRGHVTLVMFAGANCGYQCLSPYALIRRLAEQFGASLDVVFMTHTAGYYGARLVAPDSEMSLIRRHFIDQLHLPVKLAIWKTETRRRDDDVVEPVALPNEEAYHRVPSDDPTIEIVGPDGTCRMFVELTPTREVLIADVIREELARVPK